MIMIAQIQKTAGLKKNARDQKGSGNANTELNSLIDEKLC